ncbi:MAG: hydrogenase maturation protease [Ilumatobacter sp.]|uniref:hydrogenase maturation protease n=1 Tax=Ilumatobacter sp. TaxID=1967498 RepID=UPI002623794D|nr:hydrogenase maturation protease [Ilumatobacter sp.]MDJ0770092.1 hydrogenase maturation protease [Ilumatobacter sp.]
MPSTLVIGCGNDLRSDDRAGRVVAERVRALRLPGVSVLSVTQLTPELTLDIAGAHHVVFVDASVDVDTTTLTPIVPEPVDPGATSHHSTPWGLMSLTSTIGKPPERAHVVSVPVTDLGVGLGLSPRAVSGVAEAVEIIRALVEAR